MNTEFFKDVYMAAVIVLAAVAVMHLMKPRHMKKQCGPTAEQQLNPSWYAPGPTVGAKVARKSNVISLGL